jgi:hypothetical protein
VARDSREKAAARVSRCSHNREDAGDMGAKGKEHQISAKELIIRSRKGGQYSHLCQSRYLTQA